MGTPLIDLKGQRFGRLMVVERANSEKGKTRWLCECDCGNTATVISQPLRDGRTQSCGCLAKESSAKSGKTSAHKISGSLHYRYMREPGYFTMHARVRAVHGAASDHPCVDCGNAALHWSYRGDDPLELTDAESGLKYSRDAERYEPRCVPCHWAHDHRKDL